MYKLLSKSLVVVAALAVTLSFAPRAFAQAGTTADKGEVKMGYLSCSVASGWGVIFGSSQISSAHIRPPQEKWSITRARSINSERI